jgi:hypothetical protein
LQQPIWIYDGTRLLAPLIVGKGIPKTLKKSRKSIYH